MRNGKKSQEVIKNPEQADAIPDIPAQLKLRQAEKAADTCYKMLIKVPFKGLLLLNQLRLAGTATNKYSILHLTSEAPVIVVQFEHCLFGRKRLQP